MTVPGSANPLLLRSAAPTAYQVSRSLRFNGSVDSSYLSRTPASSGDRKKWTLSLWMKRSGLGTTQRVFSSADSSNSQGFYFEFTTSDTLSFYDYNNPTINWQKTTTQVFRDTSAWYHMVVVFDSANGTAGDRFQFYVNGSRVTTFGTSTDPSSSFDSYCNAARVHAIGRTGDANTGYFSGYLANVEFVDGSALTPSSFAETDATTAQWVPKLYSGSYGSQGWKLTFADNSNNTATTLGADTSGNGNNWTPNNLSVTAGAGNDALTDSPTSYGSGTSGGDVRGNFCTANPLATTTSLTLSNGNLQVVGGLVGGATYRGNSTIGVASGKWYFETTFVSVGDNTAVGIGQSNIIDQYPGQDALSYAYVFEPAVRINSNSQVSYGSALTAGDVFMCAFDLDNNKIFFGKNGTWFGSSVPASGTNPAYTLSAGTYTPIFRPQKNSGTCEIQFNFGQRAFVYTPPANFKPLVDTYLPTPTVAKPSEVMDITLYTGNGSARSITGFSFSPDFVWIKNRSNATGHRLLDTVRGATKALISQGTDAEVTESQGLTAFNSDGFSLGTGAFDYNQSGNTYVGWCFDAGSSAAATNNSGSITSTVKVNATAGFSIVTWTGNGTVGHGLNVAPVLYIWKKRNTTSNWGVNFTFLDGSLDYMWLNLTNAKGDATQAAPTSTVITIPSGDFTGSDTGVLYAFSPVAGYSSFGSYTGNGSTTDNTFVYTGMRPRFVMLKRSDSTGNWVIWDAVRNSYNVANSIILPNSSAAEYSPDAKIDILSNGFKVRDNSSDSGTNGATYIYAAFAESPFAYARAR